MNKFKVGDRVKLISTPFNKFTMGYEGVVNAIHSEHHMEVDGISMCAPECWELASSEEEKAKELLTSLGYSIEPPKPKLTGKVVVWYFEELGPSSYHVTDATRHIEGKDKITIAIVDWTEGDGLETSGLTI